MPDYNPRPKTIDVDSMILAMRKAAAFDWLVHHPNVFKAWQEKEQRWIISETHHRSDIIGEGTTLLEAVESAMEKSNS